MSDFLVATSPDLTGYVSLVKVGIVVLLTFGWAYSAQWVDRDTDVVKTRREYWNVIVLSGGLVAFFVLLVAPWEGNLFAGGVLVWAAIAGGAIVAYLFHRNARVTLDNRVWTIGHLKRLLSGSGKKVVSDKGMRVEIEDHDGKHAGLPDEAEEGRDFDAVQDFLFDVLWRRASDVEVVPTKERYRVVYKIDGVAEEQEDGLSLEAGERVLRFLKKTAGLNVEEIRRPQSGKISCGLLSEGGKLGDTDIRTSGSMAGERLTLKVRTGPVLVRLPELGLASKRLETLTALIAQSKGLVLFCAPPHHGTTTTQYSVLKSHDAYINNIHSLERDPLMDVDNVTQNAFEGANTDVNFARSLQSVLRREPGIVLVDNCEDHETALIAARAAAENRKMYMGLEAKDCFGGLSQFMKLLNDNELAAKSVIGIVGQRLVRVLCKDCREAFVPDAATLKKLNLPADKIEQFYRPPTEPQLDRKGRPILCKNCRGSGYFGRTGVFEVLTVDSAVAALIKEGAPMSRIKPQCRKNKMYYLQEEALLKVIDGTTSMKEVLRCLGDGK